MSVLALSHSDNADERDKSIRLFTFLKELTELRLRKVHTTDSYEVIWLKDVPEEPGLIWAPLAELSEEPDTWLEVKRPPKLPSVPRPPGDLIRWLSPDELSEFTRREPELRSTIVDVEADEAPTLHLDDFPHLIPQWTHYLTTEWQPWAEKSRRIKSVTDLYEQLFAIYHRQQRLGEAYEVVLGLGHLSWKPAGDAAVRRHLIVAQTDLAFDATRGTISVHPAAAGPSLTFEQDMLDPEHRPQKAIQDRAMGLLADVGDAVWTADGVVESLRTWVHGASPHGTFDTGLTPIPGEAGDPHVSLAPALIMRPRTERSIVRFITEILEKLEELDVPVPPGVQRLVSIIDDSPQNSDGVSADRRGSADADAVYFPLPANEAQREIVTRLRERQGVLVQGPPGTGKSHTIANLICHLVASGQRVLVTSHTARALEVLQDLIPPEVRELAVSLLGNDQKSMKGMEASVSKISNEFNRWSPIESGNVVARLEALLDQLRRRESDLLREARALRESETYRHPAMFGDYAGTTQEIAIRLREEEERLGWISEQIAEGTECPLSNDESAELARLSQAMSADVVTDLRFGALDLADLPPEAFAQLLDEENEARAACELSRGHRGHYAYAGLLQLDPTRLQEVGQRLSSLLTTYEELGRRGHPWLAQAGHQVLGDQRSHWDELYKLTVQTLERADSIATLGADTRVTGVEGHDLGTVKTHAIALAVHLEGGGKLGFGPFRAQAVKDAAYLLAEVHVDGQRCGQAEPLRRLSAWAEIGEALETLDREWASATTPPAGTYRGRLAAYRDFAPLLDRALSLAGQRAAVEEVLRPSFAITPPAWNVPADVRSFLDASRAALDERRLNSIETRLASAASRVETALAGGFCHPLYGDVVRAICQRDSLAYSSSYARHLRQCEAAANATRREMLLAQLRAGAPRLADEVAAAAPGDASLTKLPDLAAAWRWRHADAWRARESAPARDQELRDALADCTASIGRALTDLTAARAWDCTLSRLTEYQRQHLMAWAEAVRRIGKGTSTRATKHRAAARDHMEECRSAIPAWIMPIYRVAELMQPGRDEFDVVIVDEASQSGVEALFLNFLAKKVVVVGDHQQIAPENVGLSRESVDRLRDLYVLDLPHHDTFDPDVSFFAQARIRYSSRVRLVEHFRCMPEIIQFSNQLCYEDDPLIPLRQYGSDRLTPAVTTVHVADGYTGGSKFNLPEAEAIVEQIALCCADPAYATKSMGVISLVGDDQARLIERLLLRRLGADEIEGRRLVCGDAYAFQGSERDVIFLSLVSAPDRRPQSWTTDRHRRRLNVAASRAKDQMWLFHTVTLNDLSAESYQAAFLRYCTSPRVEQAPIEGLPIAELRDRARSDARARGDAPPSPFDSWFEVDVFLDLAARGYRIRPQYQLAGYRIDLLVEGMQGRLAVECDGDRWHGADRFEADQSRQRILERCGMTFSRVRGGNYYRDPRSAMTAVYQDLERAGIYAGVATAPPSAPSTTETAPTDAIALELHPASDAGGASKSAADESVTGEGGGSVRWPEGISSSPSLLWTTDDRVGLTTVTEPSLPDSPAAPTSFREPSSTEVGPVSGGIGPTYRNGVAVYQQWTGHGLPDPRTASVRQLQQGLLGIVEAEGPVAVGRVLDVYRVGAGLGRLREQSRQNLLSALVQAVGQGLISRRVELAGDDLAHHVVALPTSAAVVVRTRGGREFDQVPPAEIAAMMARIVAQRRLSGEALLRETLGRYDLSRLTTGVEARLTAILREYSMVVEESRAEIQPQPVRRSLAPLNVRCRYCGDVHVGATGCPRLTNPEL